LAAVPSGTRLVIETISGFLNMPAGSDPGKPFLQTSVNGVTAKHYLRTNRASQLASGLSFLVGECNLERVASL